MSNKHDLPIAAHAVMTKGLLVRLVVRDDVADEVACQYRNNGVECDVVQLVRHSEALAAIQRLESENEALRNDAERYRWLRGDCGPHSVRWPRFEVKYWTGRWWDDLRLAQMDAAIDDAMTKEQKT